MLYSVHKRLRLFPASLCCSISSDLPLEYASDLEECSKTVDFRYAKYWNTNLYTNQSFYNVRCLVADLVVFSFRESAEFRYGVISHGSRPPIIN